MSLKKKIFQEMWDQKLEEDDFDVITNWILNDCDDTHGEIHWLLNLLYGDKKPQGKLSLRDAYADVFRHIAKQ